MFGGRKRYGTPVELVQGRQWRWDIPGWSSFKLSKTYDSEKMTAFSGEKFYLHLSLNSDGIVGLYINYKGPAPAPKYTYALGTTKGFVARQHTAHSIPPDCTRCGHWNVMHSRDLQYPIQRAGDDTLVIWFQFDEDTIRPTGIPTEFVWTIPRFQDIRIGPYYSHAFIPTASPVVVSLKLAPNPSDRSEIILSVSHRHGTPDVTWFRVASSDGSTIFETPAGHYHDARREDPWPPLSYGQLVNACGRDGMINIFVRFGNEAMAASSQALMAESVRRESQMRLRIPQQPSQAQWYQGGGEQGMLMMDDDFDSRLIR